MSDVNWLRFGINLYMAGCAALVTGAVLSLILGPLMVASRESEQEYRDWLKREGKWSRGTS